MGVDLSAQLGALWRSLLLGAALALLYDGLRALRLRRVDLRRVVRLAPALHDQRAAQRKRQRLADHLRALAEKQPLLPARARPLQLAQGEYRRIMNACDLLHARDRPPVMAKVVQKRAVRSSDGPETA